MKKEPLRRSDLLAGAANDFGPLSDEVRDRLFRYFDDPSAENWSSICGIIINARGGPKSGRPRTVWQAVAAVDPSFQDISLPRRPGEILPHEKRWSKWPDALLVARAIKAALAPAPEPPPTPPRHRKLGA